MQNIKDIIKKNKKIIIFGPPASGKSTLAKQISAKYNIPAYHLDKIKRKSNWQRTPKQEIAEKINKIFKQPTYIVEGSYGLELQEILEACDLIIILDTSTTVCFFRAIKRTFISFTTGKKGAREDLAEGCKESFGIGYLKLLRLILLYKKTKGIETIKALKKYQQKVKII